MAIAETAELVAEMNLRGDFTRQAARMQRGLDGLNTRTKDLQKALGKVGQGIAKGFKNAAVLGAGAAGFLAFQVFRGVESLAELEDVTNATNQAIKSTKGVARVTADEVRKLAEKYEDLTTVDDKVIQGAENLLLTFTNVRRKAFEPTLAVALDMAEALDMDLNSAVRTLGKALQDPATGLSRLTRLGVTFTEQERRKIETLQRSGRSLEAQQVILQKLNRLYGGRARTAASGYRGSLNRLKDSAEELQQSLAGPLIRPLTRVANKLAKFAKTEDVQQGIRGIGEAFANLFQDQIVMETDTEGGQSAQVAKRVASPFTTGLALVKDAFNTVKTLPWDTIRSGLDQTFQVAAKAVDLFKGLPPELQTALVTLLAANKLTGGLVASGLKDIAGLALKSLTTITAANVTVVGKTVTGPGGGGPAPGGTKSGQSGFSLFGGGLGGILGAIALGGFASQPDVLTVEEYAKRAGWTPEQTDRALEWYRRTVEKQDEGNQTQEQQKTSTQRAVERIQELKGRFEQLRQQSGKGNDILNGIAEDAQVQANQGKALTIGQQLQRQALLRTIPLLGDIGTAARGTRAAVLSKDYNLRVAVTTNVTATTVAQGVNRVTNQNRVVYD